MGGREARSAASSSSSSPKGFSVSRITLDFSWVTATFLLGSSYRFATSQSVGAGCLSPPAARTDLVEAGDALQARGGGVLRPVAEQLGALPPDGRVREARGAADAEALEQGLVGKGALEARAGVLDEAVEDDEGAKLAVDVAVLELLADGARRLAGARGLELDDLDQVGDAAEIVDAVAARGEVLDVDRHGRVRLLLRGRDRRQLSGRPWRMVATAVGGPRRREGAYLREHGGRWWAETAELRPRPCADEGRGGAARGGLQAPARSAILSSLGARRRAGSRGVVSKARSRATAGDGDNGALLWLPFCRDTARHTNDGEAGRGGDGARSGRGHAGDDRIFCCLSESPTRETRVAQAWGRSQNSRV